MAYNFHKIVLGFITITPILAAFKDFVIENEKHLQRFDVSNKDVQMMYNEEFYEEFDENDDLRGIDSICENIEDFNRNCALFKTCSADDVHNIDEAAFNEIIQQLADKTHFHKYLGDFKNNIIHKHFVDGAYQDVENNFGNDDECW